MTVQHNTPCAATPPGFGDIPINQGPQTLSDKPARSRQQRPRQPKKKFPFILLLSLITALAALYAATIFVFVPMLVKGPVADSIGHRLNRPVLIENISLSPFGLRLHLKGISIGPDLDRKGSPPLCTLASIEGRLLPKALLQGNVVLAGVRITQPNATLIRYPDSNPLQFLQRLSAENPAGTVLPSWMRIQGLQVTDGTMIFQDQTSSRQYTVEQIQLNLPTGSQVGQTVEPTLRAVINSSPVLLQGQSHKNSDGTTETRLNLQLKKLDLQQAVSSLPDTLHNLKVNSDTAEAELEIILKDTSSAGMKITVTGAVNAVNLALQAPDQAFSLKVPTLQMLIKARPLENQYSMTSLTAVAPQLAFADTHTPEWIDIQTMLGIFLRSNTVGFTVDQLKIDQGSLEIGDQTRWHDLRLLLTNLRNKAGGSSQPASLSLQVGSKQSTAAFQGEITPTGTFAGKISLHNMEANQLQTLLADTSTTRFGQGLLQLEGSLRTQQDTSGQGSWQITDSTLKINNFFLKNNNALWATGAEMNGVQCLLQTNTASIDCQQIGFTQTDFSPAALAQLVPIDKGIKNTPRFLSFDMLKINNSTARIPLSPTNLETGTPQLILTDLQLRLSGMKQTNPGSDNLSVQAVLGKQGKINVTGKLQSSGRGVLQLAASDIDVKILPTALFSNWLAPEVRQGMVHIDGKLKLPDLRFAGSLKIDNFVAQSDNTPDLRWQQAAASEITARFAPFSGTVGRLVLDQLSITLSKGKGKLPKDLFTLLKHNKDVPILPLLTIDECVINNGRLSSGGEASEHLDLTNIVGTFAPLQNNTPAHFTLSGQINNADWITTGQTGLKIGEHALQITSYLFPPAVQALFADSLTLDTSKTTVDLTVSTEDPGTIQLTNISPLPGSDFALLLALLADQSETVSLQLPALDDTSPAAVLSRAIPNLLNRLRLQATVSPRLIINHLLPELNLPGTVEFLPGETVPDFMEGLEDYETLLTQRPHLMLAVRGNFNDTTDRQSLLQVLQEEADALRALENIRREQRRAELTLEQHKLAKQNNPPPENRLRLQEQLANLQPLPQTVVPLPVETLPNLARQRAEILRSYLINTLHIPKEKIQLLPVAAGGAETKLILQATW